VKALAAEIEACLPAGGQWCSLEKAWALGALVVGLRPQTVVEIGVWMGGSLVPMLLALRKNGAGRAIAIDPWDAGASATGEAPDNARWWAGTDHEKAYAAFVQRMHHHGVSSYCEVWRKRSDDATPPDAIDLLHVDGNHTEQAIRDVERFCPAVRAGGIAVLDDVGWTGGHVSRAVEIARGMGFADLYPLGTGIVMLRRKGGC
jgi:predicted O-methyltransferase YrrM